MNNNFLDTLDEFILEFPKEVAKDTKDFTDIIDLDSCIDRNIYIGDIYSGLGAEIDQVIRFWNRQDNKYEIPIEERKPIKLYIDSSGGSLTDTFSIIDSISLSKTPVWTIVTGCAYSGGFFIAITGHDRYAYPTASYLFHEGSTGQSSDANKFRNFADFYNTQLSQLKNITILNTDISAEEYEKHIKDDWWLTAEEAQKLGICDHILMESI